jgi:hypothetical protein
MFPMFDWKSYQKYMFYGYGGSIYLIMYILI